MRQFCPPWWLIWTVSLKPKHLFWGKLSFVTLSLGWLFFFFNLNPNVHKSENIQYYSEVEETSELNIRRSIENDMLTLSLSFGSSRCIHFCLIIPSVPVRRYWRCEISSSPWWVWQHIIPSLIHILGMVLSLLVSLWLPHLWVIDVSPIVTGPSPACDIWSLLF